LRAFPKADEKLRETHSYFSLQLVFFILISVLFIFQIATIDEAQIVSAVFFYLLHLSRLVARADYSQFQNDCCVSVHDRKIESFQSSVWNRELTQQLAYSGGRLSQEQQSFNSVNFRSRDSELSHISIFPHLLDSNFLPPPSIHN
jgi:hypothetical protein